MFYANLGAGGNLQQQINLVFPKNDVYEIYMILAVIYFTVEGVSFFVLCGVYVGATRLVHGHHEMIATRP